MPMIQFVRNYEDLSTDRGFQFKFHCDKCGNGFMSAYQTSALGVAESALKVAGNLFGGIFSTVGNSAYEIQRAVGGKAHDAALDEAVREGKQHFHQCTRCGHWVCPEVCWNEAAALCEACAPNFGEETAAAHAEAKAEAMRNQLRERAAKAEYASDIDMSKAAAVRSPGPAATSADRCTGCGTAMAADARFCPQCGDARKPTGCPGCGAGIQPGTRFCAQCGAKVV